MGVNTLWYLTPLQTTKCVNTCLNLNQKVIKNDNQDCYLTKILSYVIIYNAVDKSFLKVSR